MFVLLKNGVVVEKCITYKGVLNGMRYRQFSDKKSKFQIKIML